MNTPRTLFLEPAPRSDTQDFRADLAPWWIDWRVLRFLNSGLAEPIPARLLFKAWRWVEDAGLTPHIWPLHQPDFPRLYGDLSYRRLQSFLARYPDLLLAYPNRPPAEQGGGASGGQKAADSAHSDNEPADDGKAQEYRGPRWLRQRTRMAQIVEDAAQQRTTGPVVVRTPWPQPSHADVAAARQIVDLLHREVVEQAREAAPVRWSAQRLALYGRAGQPDRARVWEHEGLPRLAFVFDNSGSIGKQVEPLRAIAAAIAVSVPWLLVMAAPNGEPEPLNVKADPRRTLPAILDGKAWTPPGVRGNDWSAVSWLEVYRAANVAGLIYVGDYETAFMRPLHAANLPVATLSIFRSNTYASPRLARRAPDSDPWVTVDGYSGTMADTITALRLVLAGWQRI